MHRSGTSMVMSVLNDLGLNVGNEQDLMGAIPSNPEGHWENLNFLDFDDAVLSVLGGGWDCPPAAGPAAFEIDALTPLKQSARGLRDQLGPKEPWGWKDPRISLLLPFWYDVFPDLKVVVCLRSPLEVAESLRRRGSSSYEFGLSLWRTYNERILSTTRSGQRLITHYATYFARPEIEIGRLCAFVGLAPDRDRIVAAAQRIKPMHRHNVAEMPQLIASGAAPDVIDLYDGMCQEADWPVVSRDGTHDPAAPIAAVSSPVRSASLPVARGSVNSLLLELAAVRRQLADLQRRREA